MIQVKLSKADGGPLLAAVQSLATNSTVENAAKKARESAKTLIERELLKLRSVDVNTLPDKEIVLVQVDGEDVLKIERRGSQRLDNAALGAAHPAIATEFTKSSVASYFASLIK